MKQAELSQPIYLDSPTEWVRHSAPEGSICLGSLLRYPRLKWEIWPRCRFEDGDRMHLESSPVKKEGSLRVGAHLGSAIASPSSPAASIPRFFTADQDWVLTVRGGSARCRERPAS